MIERMEKLAKDLRKESPRSPHETLGGFVIAARALDKCRSVLMEIQGEYCFDCPLDQYFFRFSGIGPEAFKEFVATGATDDEIDQWIRGYTRMSVDAIKFWNMQMRQTRVADLPPHVQIFLEDYIQEHVPKNRRVYSWFDVYDLEEGVI